MHSGAAEAARSRRRSRRSVLRLAGAGALTTLLSGCLDDSAPSFLALGDSYTAGTSIDPSGRWASRLPDRLAERGIELSEPEIVAESGWTTLALSTELDRRAGYVETGDDPEPLADEYDLVTLCIGANDSFNQRLPDSFRPDFIALLDRAIRFAGGRADHVVVMTIPDYTVTPLGQRQLDDRHADRLEAYNEIITAQADRQGARLVDLVPPSRRVPENSDLVTGDDLHPSPEQYGLWLDRIVPVVAAVLDD